MVQHWPGYQHSSTTVSSCSSHVRHENSTSFTICSFLSKNSSHGLQGIALGQPSNPAESAPHMHLLSGTHVQEPKTLKSSRFISTLKSKPCNKGVWIKSLHFFDLPLSVLLGSLNSTHLAAGKKAHTLHPCTFSSFSMYLHLLFRALSFTSSLNWDTSFYSPLTFKNEILVWVMPGSFKLLPTTDNIAKVILVSLK